MLERVGWGRGGLHKRASLLVLLIEKCTYL